MTSFVTPLACNLQAHSIVHNQLTAGDVLVVNLNAMFSWKNFRLPSPNFGSVMGAASQVNRKFGPMTLCRKLKAFICMEKTSDNDTDSSETASSGEDDRVRKYEDSFPYVSDKIRLQLGLHAKWRTVPDNS